MVLVGDEAKFGLICSILFKVLCDQEGKRRKKKRKLVKIKKIKVRNPPNSLFDCVWLW